MKNRYGDADIEIGCSFHGEIGMFRQLPKPEEISDYEPYLNLNYKKDEIYVNEDKNENNEIMFKF